jgi:hypothetical protein
MPRQLPVLTRHIPSFPSRVWLKIVFDVMPLTSPDTQFASMPTPIAYSSLYRIRFQFLADCRSKRLARISVLAT